MLSLLARNNNLFNTKVGKNMASTVNVKLARANRLLESMLSEIVSHYQAGDKVRVLVPEQLTLMMEKHIIHALKKTGFIGLDVLSPSRLYERIMDETGTDENEPLSSSGQHMAISQALERLENKLPYYGSIAHTRGFINKISMLITEMQRGQLTAEQLTSYAEELEDGIHKQKCTDIALIYSQYRQVLKGQFSDQADLLVYVSSRLHESSLLTDSFLFVYGFDTMPTQMLHLLNAIAPHCRMLTIGLQGDSLNANDGELYQPIWQGIGRLRSLLTVQNISLNVNILNTMPFANNERCYIDNFLFSEKIEPLTKQTATYHRFSGFSPFEEASTMSRIIRHALNSGTDIERIAVIYPDMNGYRFAVESALRTAKIPYISASKLPMLSHSLVRYLLSALDAITYGYRNEHVLALLKSGFSVLDFNEGCVLERYVQKHGINNKRWTAPFTRGDESQLPEIESLRLRLINPLIELRKAIVSAKTSTETLNAVFSLLHETSAYDKLSKHEAELVSKGYFGRANQNSQVWKNIMDLFNQLHRLSNGARIPLKYISDRMRCGFSVLEIATLPPATKMLATGTLGHMLQHDVDIVFVMGLNDGILTRVEQGLFNDEEKNETATANSVFLGASENNLNLLAKIDLKNALLLADKHCFISYALTSPSGESLRPLSALNTITNRIFTDIHTITNVETLPLSMEQAMNELGPLLRSHEISSLPPIWKDRLAQMQAHPSGALMLKRLDTAIKAKQSALNEASKLFGDSVLSVSRLETFMQCPFRHFITHGLRPEIIRPWAVDPIEKGTFYHEALHRFASIAKKDSAFPNLSDDAITQMANEAVSPLLPAVLEGPMGDGARNYSRFEDAKAMIVRSALSLSHQLAAGNFSLFDTEVAFGYPNSLPPLVLKLKDGREIMLRGRIDRIDQWQHEESTYLRVIDYKSSANDLDAAKTWWGMQLQLLLYLDLCTHSIAGAKPAGAFYFHVTDTYIETEKDVVSLVEDKLKSIFQLKGITLMDVEIIQAMDGSDTPFVIPPVFKKSGELQKNAKVLDSVQFDQLMNHTKQVATTLAENIMDGNITISPMQQGEQLSCGFCDYHSICHFSAEKETDKVRTLPEMKMDDLRDALSLSTSSDEEVL